MDVLEVLEAARLQNSVNDADNNSLENPGMVKHTAVLYGSDEDMHSSMVPLLINSLSNEDHMCLCILDDIMYLELTDLLSKQGIDVDSAQDSERLNHLIKNEIFFTKGTFNIEQTFAIFTSIANASQAHGFKQLDIFTDMSWTLPKVLNRAEYELKLNLNLAPLNINMVCMYDLRKFSSDAVMDALRTHPAVYANGVEYKNPFFTPSERLMHEDFSDLELEYALKIIRSIYDLQNSLTLSEGNIREMGNLIKSCNSEKNDLNIALNELKIRFDQYAEGISDWIWELDSDGNFNYTSTAVTHILGLQREDILGNDLVSIVCDEDKEALSKAIEEAKYRISSFGPIDLCASNNGEKVYLRLSAVPLFHRNGTFLGYRGIAQDITNDINYELNVNSLKDEISKYASTSEENEKTITSLQADIEAKCAEIQQLNESLSGLQTDISSKNNEIEILKDEIEVGKNSLSELQGSFESKTMELTMLSSSLAAFKEESERLTEKLIQAQTDLSTTQAELSALKADSDNEISVLKGELLSAQTKLEDINAVIESKNAEIITLTTAAAALADEKQALESQMASAKSDLDNSTKELTSLTAELEELKTKYSKDISSLTEQLSSSNSSISDLSSSLGSKNSELLTLTAAAALLADEKQSLESQLESLKSDLKGTISEMTSSAAEVELLKNSNSELKVQLQEANNLIAELRASKDSADSEISSLVEKVMQKENELNIKESELSLMRSELLSKSDEIDKFNNMLTVKDEEITCMLNTVSSREGELKELHEKISKMNQDMEDEISSMRAELKNSLALRIEDYYDVLDSSAEAIWVIDNKGITTFTNKRVSEIFGYSKEELHDKTPTDFMNKEWLNAEDRKVLEERMIKFVRKDGSDLWVMVSSIPLISHDGTSKGMMGILVDITELKKSVMQVQKPVPQKDPNEFMDPLNDAFTSVLSNIALVKDYVIPEGRMYDKLIRVQEASEAAVKAVGYDKLPDLSMPLIHGSGKILIIDDNDAVSESLSDLLMHLGYDPDFAADCEEGLDLCTDAATDNRPFAAAIIDINVPGCMDAISKISAASPGIKLIASDVMAGDPIGVEPSAFGFAAAIAKPFSAGELSSLLNEVLN